MTGSIAYTTRPPDTAAYARLFETTGWNEIYHQPPEAILAALRASWAVMFAYADERLVGSGRLVSDGVQYAVVFDMVVDPAHQRRGIGDEILRRLLNRCRAAGIRDVLLFAAHGTAGFYARHGFAPRPAEAPGMLLRGGPVSEQPHAQGERR